MAGPIKPKLIDLHRKGAATLTPKESPSLAARLEGWGKTGLIAVGLCYGLGLFITNAYLSKYGISEFSAFRTQYVLTGVSFIIFAAAPGGAIGVGMVLFRRMARDNRVFPMPLLLRIFTFVTYVLPASFAFVLTMGTLLYSMMGLSHGYTLGDLDGILIAVAALLAFYTLLGGFLGIAYVSAAVFFALARPTRKSGTAPHFAVSFSYGYLLITAISLCLTVLVYARQGYEIISPAFGGGYPETVNIELDKMSLKDACRLCLLENDSSEVITAKLIHESSDAYFLLPPDTTTEAKCIRLPKSMTRGLVYLKNVPEIAVPSEEAAESDSTAAQDSSLPTDSAVDSVQKKPAATPSQP